MEERESDYFFWADKVAEELEARSKKHVVHGGWTPSGFFHIGNSRGELMIPSFVMKALSSRCLEAKQQLIIDDFDDFDKIPAGMDLEKKKFEPFLGKPLREVPSPKEGFDSWAHYFLQDVLDNLERFGLSVNIISSYDSYKAGKYDEAIKICLDKSEQIRHIWNEVTSGDKPKGWIPIMVICEKCGRSATTKATSWNGNELEYRCNQDREYAPSCGHKGRIVPQKGNAKLPWRLHWPANWYIHGVTFESAGKDHFSAGGSVESGQRFIKEIFEREGPLQPRAEFLLVDNAKLSGSSGNTISLSDWAHFAEPELLRFMMASFKRPSVIIFDLHSNKFFLLTDRYEKAEQAYFEEDTDKRSLQLTKTYECAQIKAIPERIPVQLNYSIAAMIVQVFPNKPLSELVDILHKNGWIHRKTLNAFDKDRLAKRLELARNWLAKYAPDDVKFQLQDSISAKLQLSDKEKKSLHTLASKLREKDWTQEELFEEFYRIFHESGISNTDFFKACYKALLNRERGPKLAPFILTVGKEKVIELFEKV